MAADVFDVVPAAQREAAERAVRETFPEAEATALTVLHGGLSGQLVLKLELAERAYVLRVSVAPWAAQQARGHFAAMQIAAGLGIAPAVLYADEPSGICITDFIAGQPIGPALRQPEQQAQLAAMLRRLHSGPAFPTEADTFAYLHSLRAQLGALGITPPGWVEGFLDQFAAVEAALRPHLVSAPSHNDVNPNNMLFDGTRLWLIDWEVAAMNEPMLDISNLLYWFGWPPEQEAAFLRAYLGTEPDARQRAKLTLMRQTTRCFYTLMFLLLAAQFSQGKLPEALEREQLPDVREVIHGLGAGTLQLDRPQAMQTLSLATAKAALAEQEQPAFIEALALLRAT
ncbi:MAG TPA: choline/ethanolamine kinase family protein [Roseiflexaceae bacterium]|nr:choline/ethanolamine kinase family protein [Roseiflexaceae bacterium]